VSEELGHIVLLFCPRSGETFEKNRHEPQTSVISVSGTVVHALFFVRQDLTKETALGKSIFPGETILLDK